jgi:hypothetical protein
VKARWLLLILAATILLLALVLVLRESGALEWNLYRSQASTDRVAMFGVATPGEGNEGVSYDLRIYYDGELVETHSYRYGDKPVLAVDLELAPTLSGNDWTPLYKSFSVEFSTSFASSAQGGQYSVEGEINGTTEMTITGLCTRRKARELAREEVVKSVREGLVEQLDNQP